MLSTRQYTVALFAIGLTWVALRAIYWNGYYTEDAPGYVTDAIWMALGRYGVRDYVNGLNVGTYLPVALPIRVFGKSEVALSLWPLLCSLLGLTSVAGLSTILFGRAFGLLAALLYATYPGDVFFSTVVMPDSIQAGWLSFSMLLVAFAHGQASCRKQWLLVAGGVAMGICHLVRANDLILAPVGIGAAAIMSALWNRDTLAGVARACLAYLRGWVLVYVLEGLAYLWAAGDFFHRVQAVGQHYGTPQSIAAAGLNIDANTIPFSIFAPLMWWSRGGWGVLNHEQSYHALMFFWALVALSIGLVALLIDRDRAPDRAVAGLVAAALWFIWPLIYHQYGSQSLTAFVPMHRLSRHLVVYAPGAIVAAIAGCFFIKSAIWRCQSVNLRRALLAGGAAVLAVHLYFNWQGEQVVYGAYQRIKRTYNRILDHLPNDVTAMVADPGDLCFFDFWLNPLGAEPVRMIAYANYSRCEEIERSVVLTHSNPGWEGMGAPVIQETVKRLPCLINPPATWRLLYEGYPEKVYTIGPAFDGQR